MTWVAEVKSITPQNEERQLRTALGQVLRYAQLLEDEGRMVKTVIATEAKPNDTTWIDCARARGSCSPGDQTGSTLRTGVLLWIVSAARDARNCRIWRALACAWRAALATVSARLQSAPVSEHGVADTWASRDLPILVAAHVGRDV